MSTEKNPYKLLGIPEDSILEDIKAAYRKIARRLHPDVNQNNEAAQTQFQEISNAHELLTNSSRKAAFDLSLRSKKPDDDYFFTFQTLLSKQTIFPLAEPQVVYLLAEIHPDPRASEIKQRESNLNLTLVLDQSNSMSGARIERVKVAAHQIIDSLTENDIISVVVFNDRAEIIIPATRVTDKPALKAKVSLMTASGGTEIYQGLSAGINQTRQYLGPKLVNHLILLTDGHTFGDQDQCIQLATKAALDGIGISAMGLGHDWNDKFLDELASKTGGSSSFISSIGAVVKFMNEHVRNLSNVFAERMILSVATDSDTQLESAFKLSPHPQPLSHEGGNIVLGGLPNNRPISVLLQFQAPPQMPEGQRHFLRLVVSGEILANTNSQLYMVRDPLFEISKDISIKQDPPTAILDALSKLTLYRLQERAQDALANGDVNEATRRLENLATRLLEMGKKELAEQALSEAKRVNVTHHLSTAGRMTLKYQTRHLLSDETPLESET
ncbi:MAG: VWA domain-containing protein [Phototrophicales bacterium]|nr:VWA domain-containing protein [Phototrophicales bacterium]